MSERQEFVHLASQEGANPSTDHVITVDWNGFIRFKGHRLRVSSALHRLPIGIRASTEIDGLHDLYFCHQRFMQIDLRDTPHN